MIQSENKTPQELIEAVINSKYAEYLENEYPDYRERIQDLEQLAKFSERQPDLHRFLAEATLQEGFNAKQARSQTADNDDEKIVLSTIHQAKGLEWEAVFIMNVSAGQFPSERSLKEKNGVEEERRLFYVAVTRAQKQLYMTYPLVGGFDTMFSGPSIFLEEIDRDLVEQESINTSMNVFSNSNVNSDEITYVSEDEPFSSSPKKLRPKSFLSSIDDL